MSKTIDICFIYSGGSFSNLKSKNMFFILFSGSLWLRNQSPKNIYFIYSGGRIEHLFNWKTVSLFCLFFFWRKLSKYVNKYYRFIFIFIFWRKLWQFKNKSSMYWIYCIYFGGSRKQLIDLKTNIFWLWFLTHKDLENIMNKRNKIQKAIYVLFISYLFWRRFEKGWWIK